MGGGGAYSPYLARLWIRPRFWRLHTAHFQYIPALALPTKDTLNLRLNMPPSFRDPKSVVVVALPPMGHPNRRRCTRWIRRRAIAYRRPAWYLPPMACR